MSKGFAFNGWPLGTELINSADLVAHATPHTKGSWVEIDASTARDVVGMMISSGLTIGVSAVDTSMLLDVGVGAAAAETVVVADIPVGGHQGGQWFFLPLHVPAGSRIAGRIQGAVTVDIYRPVVILLFGGRPGSWGGYAIAETIGIDTATSAPTTGDLADNAWDEAIASTANAYRALTLHPSILPSAGQNGSSLGLIEIGVGGAGSEVALGGMLVGGNTIESISFSPFAIVEQSVAAGSRLAIRKNNTGDLSACLIGWR
jgi:hypothetical protein